MGEGRLGLACCWERWVEFGVSPRHPKVLRSTWESQKISLQKISLHLEHLLQTVLVTDTVGSIRNGSIPIPTTDINISICWNGKGVQQYFLCFLGDSISNSCYFFLIKTWPQALHDSFQVPIQPNYLRCYVIEMLCIYVIEILPSLRAVVVKTLCLGVLGFETRCCKTG